MSFKKSDLIDAVAGVTGHTKKDIDAIVTSVFDLITVQLRFGNEVRVSGFGTFSVKDLAERKARKINTQEVITIPACKRVKFKSAKGLV